MTVAEQIVDYLRSTDAHVTSNDIARNINRPAPSVRRTLCQLVDRGVLYITGPYRNQWYHLATR